MYGSEYGITELAHCNAYIHVEVYAHFLSRKGDSPMAKETIIASDMILGSQVTAATIRFRDALFKHNGEISQDVMEQILETRDCGMIMYEALRRQAEEITKQVVRRVDKVDRTMDPFEMLDIFRQNGFTMLVNDEVAASMPRGSGEDAVIIRFCKAEEFTTCDGLEEQHGHWSVPADPYSLMGLAMADLTFVDKYQPLTHWRGLNGRWCYLEYSCCRGFRQLNVGIDRRNSGNF